MERPLMLDPSRTVTIRKRFLTEMESRYKLLENLVRKVIDTEDALGIQPLNFGQSGDWGWRLLGPSGKLEQFQDWFQYYFNFFINRKSYTGYWFQGYVQQIVFQALARAYTDVSKVSIESEDFKRGRKLQFISSVIDRQRIELFSTRLASQLEGSAGTLHAAVNRAVSHHVTTNAEVLPLFVYGTFKNKKIIDKAAEDRKLTLMPARLKGYKRVLVHYKTGYYTLEPSENEAVKGDLVHLTAAELKRTDAWESRYKREEVTLADGTKAWAYFWHGKMDTNASSSLIDTLVDEIHKSKIKAFNTIRHEISHIFAESQLDAFEKLKVESVVPHVEWTERGVCTKCSEYIKPHTIQEARGVFPVHPGCLCIWSPVRGAVKFHTDLLRPETMVTTL